jgi:pSer/pThr/pTyr-binding forkhead associated (FHA) protein
VGKLVHFRPDGSPVELKLDRQRMTIGRRADNDLCLPYPAVSGEHAVILTILDDSFLEDLGSTNGTLVNGAAVAKHFLRDRDEIDVGRHILIYCADDAATVERPSPPTDVPMSAKRRPDSVPQRSSANGAETAPAIARDATSGVEATTQFARPPDSAASAPDATPVTPAPPPKPFPFSDGEPALKVVSGAKAGRIVALVKDETLIGRPGVQVVALRRTSDEVRLVPIEGATPPCVNGVRVVAAEGHPLAVGDIVEIAGSKLEVIVPTKRSAA